MNVDERTLEAAGIDGASIDALRRMRIAHRAGVPSGQVAKVNLGNVTAVTLGLVTLNSAQARVVHVDSGGALVSVLYGSQGHCYPFQPGSFYHAGYVASRLADGNACDGTALSLVLAYLMDGQAGPACDCPRHRALEGAATNG